MIARSQLDQNFVRKITAPPTVTTAIFGAADGLVATMALILATESRGRKVVLAAAIGLLIAEGLGMAASQVEGPSGFRPMAYSSPSGRSPPWRVA